MNEKILNDIKSFQAHAQLMDKWAGKLITDLEANNKPEKVSQKQDREIRRAVLEANRNKVEQKRVLF